MTAITDHERDLRDFVPKVEIVNKLKELRSRSVALDFCIKGGNANYTPIRNIDKIDLDPRKTVTLKCCELL